MKTIIRGTISGLEFIRPSDRYLEPIGVLSIVDNDGKLKIGYGPATVLYNTIRLLFGDHPEGAPILVRLDHHAVVEVSPLA